MANLKDLNDGGELTSVITCRVPADMKGDAIKAAAKEKLTLSQWMAFLVERALNPKTSVLVGRDELNEAISKARNLAKQVSDLNAKLDHAVKANQGWSKSGENSKKSLSAAQTALQTAQSKVKELETRIAAANKYIAADTFIGKPKQF